MRNDPRALSGEQSLSPSSSQPQSSSPLGRALYDAVRSLRAELRDEMAPVTLVLPAGPNTALARRALATQGPIFRVWFETPEGILRQQLPVDPWRELQPEPAGWLRVTLSRIVDELAANNALGRFNKVLRRRGWRDPLVAAISRLERDDVAAVDLRALAAMGAGVRDDVAERAALLASIVETLDSARTKAGIASPRALAEAATRAALARKPGVGASLAHGAVVVGDSELSASVSHFFSVWLAQRKVMRVTAPPSGALPAAPRGMRELCGADAREIVVDTSALPARLRTLTTRVFTEQQARAAPASVDGIDDDSVTLARTPDDVRECVECVREVQHAIARGVALDRIGIVLPDSAQRGPLEDALERAEIPATWLVGYAARDLPAARLLRLTLDIACAAAARSGDGTDSDGDGDDGGDESVARVYELLAHPLLDLRRALGEKEIRGRGRWRRFLSVIHRARGLDRIASGMEKMALLVETEREQPELEEESRRSLIVVLRALHSELRALDVNAPLGQHARVWSSFLQRWGRVSESRAKLLALLEPWALTNAGPALSIARARDELESLLEREVARGSLSERSIRVLPPMVLLGGELDVVCILGLTEGRFPVPAKEDAILPDDLLVALSQRLDRPLSLSQSRVDVERRRFAAAVAAARKRVWLSVPALSFDEERPTLPSTFALDVAGALLGRRARYADLASLCVRSGSRARSWPPNPDDSVGTLEHLIARLARDPVQALPALTAHPTARNVLQLHRSIAARAQRDVVDAWTGLVSPQTLTAPGLDGKPVPVGALVELLSSLGLFFFHSMLRAYPARILRTWTPALERPTLEALLVDVARSAPVDAGADAPTVLASRLVEQLEKQRDLGAFDDAALTQTRPLIDALSAALAGDAAGYLRSAALVGELRVTNELPWVLRAAAGRVVDVGRVVDGSGEGELALIDLARKVKRKTLRELDGAHLTLSALALASAGKAKVDTLHVMSPSRGTASGSAAELAATALVLLAHATDEARRGRFVLRGADAFTLAGERAIDGADAEGDA